MIAVIMIPNIIFAVRCKEGFQNKWSNKFVEVAEQIGRFGCFGFMIINIPGTWFGWWSDEAFAIYLIVDAILVVLYCAIWIICFKNSSIFRTLALSIIPSVLFLFSGIMSRSVLLIVSSLLFAPAHILISYKTCFIKIMFANLSNQIMYCTSLNKYSRSLPFSSSRTKRPSCSTRSRRAENLPPASS